MLYLDPFTIEINPYQPRQYFAPEQLHDLARSIKEYGILQPIVVRKVGRSYQLIAGERRLRAARLLKLSTVPVIVTDHNNQSSAILALIENIQRQDLNPLEEAQGYALLQKEFYLTQEDLAQKTGKSRSHIANLLRLLKLSPGVQTLIKQNKLTMGQAKPLLALPLNEQLLLAQTIINKNLSARQVEKIIKQQAKDPLIPQNSPRKTTDQGYEQYLEDIIRHRLGTATKLKLGKEKSTLEITFYSPEDLERLLDILDPPTKEEPKNNPPKNFCI